MRSKKIDARRRRGDPPDRPYNLSSRARLWRGKQLAEHVKIVSLSTYGEASRNDIKKKKI